MHMAIQKNVLPAKIMDFCFVDCLVLRVTGGLHHGGNVIKKENIF